MKQNTRPRYFDGKVRKVVSVRWAPRTNGARGQRIETLECGHLYAPSFPASGGNTRFTHQYRVCDECEVKP